MFMPTVLVLVCLAFYAPVIAQSNEAKMIAEYGKAVKIPTGIFLPEGQSPVSVVWKRGDDTLAMKVVNTTTYSDTRALLDADYSLRLSELNFTDAGQYRVDIVTYAGAYSQTHEVQILASPDVIARAIPVIDDGSDGERIVAECEAKGGSDSFSISWYEDDNLLVNGTDSRDSENADFDFLIDSSLQLSLPVTALVDNGRVVTCVVTDAFGRRIEKAVSLIVTEPTTTVPTTTVQASPAITKFPKDGTITLVVGKSRTMTCRATGVPDPTVAWYKDGEKMKSGIGESKIEILADDYSQSGVYSCEATNGEGVDLKELTLNVQGPPVIVGAENLENGTEKYALDKDDEFVNLVCESDAYPIPEIEWSVEGANFSALEKSHETIRSETDRRVSSYLNISTRHFSGENSISRIECNAKNNHGDAQKTFIVSLPIASSNVGVITGVAVVLVLVLILLIAVTIYCLLVRKRQGTMTTSAESGTACPLSTCCGEPKVKSKELKEEDDIATAEQVKEVDEEGTTEEKQKLTEAEESPANEEEKTEEPKEDEKEEEKKDEEKPVKKSKISLPLQCCKGNKKEIEANTDEAEVEQGEDNEAGNGKTQMTEEAERDSGKGDTLEKVIEEESTQK